MEKKVTQTCNMNESTILHRNNHSTFFFFGYTQMRMKVLTMERIVFCMSLCVESGC